jgi:predicted nucleic acid-binding Zn ribbon protein
MKSAKDNKGDFQSVGQAIRELLNSYHLSAKFDETNVIESWERLVGKPIAKRTRKVFIKNKVLYVEFDSSSMKHDFLFHKPEVLNIFKKEFGEDLILDIVIL